MRCNRFSKVLALAAVAMAVLVLPAEALKYFQKTYEYKINE